MFSLGPFLFVNTRDRQELSRRIEFVRGLPGVQHVEVWLEPGDWTDEDTAFLGHSLVGLPIIVHAPFVNMTVISDHQELNKASLAIWQRTADVCQELGARVMTIHLGRKAVYMPTARAFDIAAPYLQKLLQYVHDELTVSVENLPPSGGTATSFPKRIEDIELCLRQHPGLYFTVDIGHLVLDGVDPGDIIRGHIDRIADIHLHNVIRGGREHFGFNETGDVNVQNLLEVLRTSHYDGYVSLEIFTQHQQDMSESWERIRSSIA